MPLTEIELVQTTFKSVATIADEAADPFYGRRFEIALAGAMTASERA